MFLCAFGGSGISSSVSYSLFPVTFTLWILDTCQVTTLACILGSDFAWLGDLGQLTELLCASVSSSAKALLDHCVEAETEVRAVMTSLLLLHSYASSISGLSPRSVLFMASFPERILSYIGRKRRFRVFRKGGSTRPRSYPPDFRGPWIVSEFQASS